MSSNTREDGCTLNFHKVGFICPLNFFKWEGWQLVGNLIYVKYSLLIPITQRAKPLFVFNKSLIFKKEKVLYLLFVFLIILYDNGCMSSLLCVSVKCPKENEWMIDPIVIADIYGPEV
jgi:hypothetical protein